MDLSPSFFPFLHGFSSIFHLFEIICIIPVNGGLHHDPHGSGDHIQRILRIRAVMGITNDSHKQPPLLFRGEGFQCRDIVKIKHNPRFSCCISHSLPPLTYVLPKSSKEMPPSQIRQPAPHPSSSFSNVCIIEHIFVFVKTRQHILLKTKTAPVSRCGNLQKIIQAFARILMQLAQTFLPLWLSSSRSAPQKMQLASYFFSTIRSPSM